MGNRNFGLLEAILVLAALNIILFLFREQAAELLRMLWTPLVCE